MEKPETVYHSFEEAVRACYGEKVFVAQTVRVAGGDINQAYRLLLTNGNSIFVKANKIGNMHFFETEKRGLDALRQPKAPSIPKTIGIGVDKQRNVSFLAMIYIERTPRISSYWEIFGHELAELHKAEAGAYTVRKGDKGKYGFIEDNYIGASPQKNTLCENWIDFYRDCRLIPQLRMAEKYFSDSLLQKADRLLSHLNQYMREPEFPSILHGDLWSGNILCGPDGKAWLIDPAVYVGDFETDLAMTQLFGSLPEKFYSAYNEINPVDWNGYKDRRLLYDLYHLLNHLNLFGGTYYDSVRKIIGMFA